MEKLNIAIVGATGVVGTELMELLRSGAFPWETAPAGVRAQRRPDRSVRRPGHSDRGVVRRRVSSDRHRVFQRRGRGQPTVGADGGRGCGRHRQFQCLSPRSRRAVGRTGGEPRGGAQSSWHHRESNCSTTIMLTALHPIYREAGIERIVVSTYQAVSGAGAGAMRELVQQVHDYHAGKPLTAEYLPTAAGEEHYPICLTSSPRWMCSPRTATRRKNGRCGKPKKCGMMRR